MSQIIPPASSLRGCAALLLACATAGACDHSSLDPDAGAPASAPARMAGAAGASVGPPPAAVAFAGGIPIGMFAQPSHLLGDRYNGAHRNIPVASLRDSLAVIRERGGKVVLAFAGNDRFYKDADGHFSLSMWQARIDRYRGVDFAEFIDDGTVIAHYIVDEPNDPANWNGQRIPPSTVEAMAEYSKGIWPNLATVVRVEPEYLAAGGADYRYLDAAWAQYVHRKGDVRSFIQRNVADARSLGLELVVGLNLLMGGPQNAALTADEIQEWGSALLDDPYPCAFLSWQYDATFVSGEGIGGAMDVLRARAQSRESKSCRAANGPPPPPQPSTTTTTIISDDPDPSNAGQAVTIQVRVDADGSTPGGSVTVTAGGAGESCEATLSGGEGACSLALTETGSRTLTASYASSSSFDSSSDTAPHQVRAVRRSVAIAWPAPADIGYGTPLGAAQLNAAASSGGEPVPGSFSYEPAAGAVLNAGASQTLRVTFTPSDTDGYESAQATAAITVVPAAPAIAWTVPTSTLVGPLDPRILNATAAGLGGAAVPGAFTYTPAAGQVLDAKPAQTLSVAFQSSQINYGGATKSVTLAVLYPWSGFFSPVDNLGRINVAKAGVAIPVRFSLGGNRPLPILASGSPQVTKVSCPSWSTDAIEQTVSASSSSLRYEAAAASYVYTWKTSTSWANSCRKLTFVLKDGTRREAMFGFLR